MAENGWWVYTRFQELERNSWRSAGPKTGRGGPAQLSAEHTAAGGWRRGVAVARPAAATGKQMRMMDASVDRMRRF